MPAQVSELLSEVKERYAKSELWVSKLNQRQLIFLIIGIGIAFLALGLLFGLVFSPYRPTPTPNVDLSLVGQSGGNPPIVSQTGTVRRLTNPENNANFYLEKTDQSQTLLESKTIDLSFFEGAPVIVEGTLGKAADGEKEVLLVGKVRIK